MSQFIFIFIFSKQRATELCWFLFPALRWSCVWLLPRCGTLLANHDASNDGSTLRTSLYTQRARFEGVVHSSTSYPEWLYRRTYISLSLWSNRPLLLSIQTLLLHSCIRVCYVCIKYPNELNWPPPLPSPLFFQDIPRSNHDKTSFKIRMVQWQK